MRKLTKREKYLVEAITYRMTQMREAKAFCTNQSQWSKKGYDWCDGYYTALEHILDLIMER